MDPRVEKALKQRYGFRLIRRIGRGGFAEVWEARTAQNLPCALKVSLDPVDSSHPEVQKELEHLKRLQGLLGHPHVVSLMDIWQIAGYLVTRWEYAPEGSLEDRLRLCWQQGMPSIPVEEVLTYIEDAAEGIDFLNGCGIVHRDIKPSNLLLFHGRVKVADLGLAKFVQVWTGSHTRAGTLGYLAPEAYQGGVSPTMDLYSLAATYVKLRTGCEPFGNDPSEIIARQQAGHPLVERLFPQEAELVREALQPDPARRPQNGAQAWVRELRCSVLPPTVVLRPGLLGQIGPTPSALASGGPGPCGPTALKRPQDRFDKSPTKHRRVSVWLRAGLGAAVLGAGIVGVLWTNHPLFLPQESTRVTLEKSQNFQTPALPAPSGPSEPKPDASGPTPLGAAVSEVSELRNISPPTEGSSGLQPQPVDQLGDLPQPASGQERSSNGSTVDHGFPPPDNIVRPHPPQDCPPVYCVAFSPDGTKVLTGSADNTAKLWDATVGRELLTFRGHFDDVNAVAFSPDGTLVLTGSSDTTVLMWNATTGDHVGMLQGHSAWVWCVAVSPDGTKAITGSDYETAKLWDLTTGKEIRTFQGHSGRIWCVAFSPDGAQALTGSEDGTAKLWDVLTGDELGTLRGHTDWVWAAAFSADGAKILTGSFDKTAKLWDAKTGEEILCFRGHTGFVRSVGFSPDATKVITGSEDGTAKIWDAATGEEIRALCGHNGKVFSVAFSPDGTTVLTGSLDGTARLWDVNNGQQIAQFWHVRGGGWVVITPDGYFDYDGAPETLNAITLVEPGTERELSPEEFRPYHRPDLVRAALQQHR